MSAYDLIVIGSGPGGYVAAIRAAQLGFKTALVEKDKTLGGTCLNVGCIPSKAMLESSHKYEDAHKEFAKHGIGVGGLSLDLAKLIARKDQIVKIVTGGVAGLMKKHAIDILAGTGRIAAANQVAVNFADGSGEKTFETKRILIATGSVPSVIPGVELDGERVVTSTEALNFQPIPKHLIVIGAGVIGLELGSVWRRLGAEVTVVEYMDRVFPTMDAEISTEAKRVFERQGIKFKLGVKVTSAKKSGDEGVVAFTDAQGQAHELRGDRVLVAVGRRAFADKLGCEQVGVELDKRGRVVVDKHWQTKVPGIYAIGDVVAGAMLAHKASEEGVAAVEYMATGVGHVNYDAIPSVVYTHPEIASLGRTEEELKAAGVEYRKGKFPFIAIARARAIGATDGFVKILSDAKTDRILGAHIIGAHAGDLLQELVVAKEMDASAEDVARASHAHPSLSEAIKEAALDSLGRVMHI